MFCSLVRANEQSRAFQDQRSYDVFVTFMVSAAANGKLYGNPIIKKVIEKKGL